MKPLDQKEINRLTALLATARHELEELGRPLRNKIDELRTQLVAASFSYELNDVISWEQGHRKKIRRSGRIVGLPPDPSACYQCYTIRTLPKSGEEGTIIKLWCGEKSIRLEEQPVVPTVGAAGV